MVHTRSQTKALNELKELPFRIWVANRLHEEDEQPRKSQRMYWGEGHSMEDAMTMAVASIPRPNRQGNYHVLRLPPIAEL